VIDADSVVDGILGFAQRHRITQCVVGESLRPAWQEILGGSVVNRLIRQASEMDIHVIARRER
jgi:two-component system, OmpR family, sensor histidine kinase KdpD